MGDFVPGYEASAVQGMGAPKNTPAEIVDKLNREVNAGLSDPKLNVGVIGRARLEAGSRGAGDTDPAAAGMIAAECISMM